jgi:hypothetical protein
MVAMIKVALERESERAAKAGVRKDRPGWRRRAKPSEAASE